MAKQTESETETPDPVEENRKAQERALEQQRIGRGEEAAEESKPAKHATHDKEK